MTGPALALIAVFGLMVGSFLNVCIGRLPRAESVIFPRSRCPSCRAPIRWYDNLPVLSYLILRGRCRDCRRLIGLRYPLVEIATAAAFTTQAILVGGDPVRLAERLILTGLLIVLFGTDLETQRLPNVLTLPGAAAGLLFGFWLAPAVEARLVGAAVGAGLLWGVRWIWLRLRNVEAMGLGDVKMLAMIGAFLGWQQVWLVLLLSSLGGAVVGIALTAWGTKSMQSRLPFGTFLAIGAFIASAAGERLIDWYVGLL